MTRRSCRMVWLFCEAAGLALILSLAGLKEGRAELWEGEEESGPVQEVPYAVYFIGSDSPEQMILNPQRGSAAEGTCLEVSFPEKIVGADGFLWRAEEKSPQKIELYQSGVHKYYISYRQGKRIDRPEDEDEAARKKLEMWMEKAWEADCVLTGQKPGGERESNLISGNDSQNNARIRNLVSMIKDTEWHYFYLIGRNYTPRTEVLGAYSDLLYSSMGEAEFAVGQDRYLVIRVGVMRRPAPERCTHEWEQTAGALNSCLSQGYETWLCQNCNWEETVFLPALGHLDENGDSLCDRCLRRGFGQETGSCIETVLDTEGGALPLSFTCLDPDYNGTGAMLYLADAVLGPEITGECFETAEYNSSRVRRYLNGGFAGGSSLGPALLPIQRTDGDQLADFAVLLSREEYERYDLLGRIPPTESYYLRTAGVRPEEQTGFAGKMDAVDEGGRLVLADLSGEAKGGEDAEEEVEGGAERRFGIRPAVLLERPSVGEEAEPFVWREGDVQMRSLGGRIYRFRCIDEDYSDGLDGHRTAALFLCDRVIRSDVDSDSLSRRTLCFGSSNNYKTSKIRKWLNENSGDSRFQLEPVSIGVGAAYTGSTEQGEQEQFDGRRLVRYDIGFQLIQDRMFCLSLEEAVKYRRELWRFGTSESDAIRPEAQVSPYSQGYYLRTPFYGADENGLFQYGSHIYVVDLVNGNIHTAETDSETYGLRPAFVLPQEGQR